jgi:hypothetical protein
LTEREWLASVEPAGMLRWVVGSGRLTERKLRLLACACLRQLWPLLEERVRTAVALIEGYADGKVSGPDLERAWAAATAASHEAEGTHGLAGSAEGADRDPRVHARRAAGWVVGGYLTPLSPGTDLAAAACGLLALIARAASLAAGDDDPTSRWLHESPAQAEIIRELFGPLTHRQVQIEQSWRTPAVVALATSIYEERRWEDMPILGDALSEAGCTDAEVLDHCRGPALHARGCWVVDLLLNRE